MSDCTEMRLMQARIPLCLLKEVDHLAIDLNLWRAATVEMLLNEALSARRKAKQQPGEKQP